MFFGLDPVGTLIFYFSKKHILYLLYTKHILEAHVGPRWSAHTGPIQGPGEKPPDPEPEPDPDPDELSDPNQVPSHRAQGQNTSLRAPSLRHTGARDHSYADDQFFSLQSVLKAGVGPGAQPVLKGLCTKSWGGSLRFGTQIVASQLFSLHLTSR